jgi:hypothetical protein
MRVIRLFLFAVVLSAASPPPGVASFVGKYPFDKIRGVSFLTHPRVKGAVRAAVFEHMVAEEVLGDAVTVPITKRGSLMISWACRPHDCADVNWTVVILSPNGPAAVWYHNAELKGAQSRWFIGGFAKFRNAGDCADGAVPDNVAAALATAQ